MVHPARNGAPWNRSGSPKVEYSLTEMGASLMKTATRLFAWVDDHRSEISEARAEYDARIVAS
jgi:DNA-binding HxlR family transcriptional regulator